MENSHNTSLSKVLKLLLDLSMTDIEVLDVLLREYSRRGEPLSVLDIASITGKSRSTVERSLHKLWTIGLINRRMVLAKSGGYTYVYYPKPIEEIREFVKQKLDEFCRNLRKVLNNAEFLCGVDCKS